MVCKWHELTVMQGVLVALLKGNAGCASGICNFMALQLSGKTFAYIKCIFFIRCFKILLHYSSCTKLYRVSSFLVLACEQPWLQLGVNTLLVTALTF